MKAKELAPSEEPTIPSDLYDLLEGEEAAGLFEGVDKAANPAERIATVHHLSKDLDRVRPLLVHMNRDADAQKEIDASRRSAMSTVSQMNLRTRSSLLDQFNTAYIPRVFNIQLPYVVGGPDFPKQSRYRRTYEDAPSLLLDGFTAMMGARVEAQIRWDWELNPALRS